MPEGRAEAILRRGDVLPSGSIANPPAAARADREGSGDGEAHEGRRTLVYGLDPAGEAIGQRYGQADGRSFAVSVPASASLTSVRMV